MDKSITVSFILDDQSYHGAYSAHLRHRYFKWLVIRSFVCVSFVLFGAYFITLTQERLLGNFLVVLGSVGLLRPMIWQMWHERLVRKNPAFKKKLTYTFSEKGLRIAGNKGVFELSWNEIFELVISARGVLIYQTKKSYLWIPKAAFEIGEMEKLTEFTKN
jgi:hypothetical protein